MPDIIIRVAPIQLGVGKIGIAKTADVPGSALQAVGESRTDVIKGVRPGVVRNQTYPSVVQVLRLEFSVQGIVATRSATAPHVDRGVLLVWPREAFSAASDEI